ncbi:MAG: hypothetical protein ABI112_00945 [Terracoccus sp.]
MAIYKKGADPVALRASAERLTAYAQECDGARGEASKAMGALGGNWSGGDLDHLMTKWPPIESQLGQFSTHLGQLAQALQRNAAQQEGASGSGPGTAGGSGSGSGGTGGSKELPGLNVARAVWAPIKGIGTAAGLVGTGMKIKNFVNNLATWDRDASLFGNLKNSWNTGRLAEFGKALNPKNWSSLSTFIPALEEGSGLAKTLGGFGKVLGPVGVVFGGLSVANDLSEGNYGRAGYDTVMTGLGATALICPVTAPFLLPVAGAMAVGELVYDHWDDIADFTSTAVDAVGDFAGDAVDAVGDVAGHAMDAIGDVAEDLWPF